MSLACQETASVGTPDAYREFIAETLNGAGIHVQLGVTYASIGDDAGLAYSVRCLVACARAAVGALTELRSMKAALATEPGSSAPSSLTRGEEVPAWSR